MEDINIVRIQDSKDNLINVVYELFMEEFGKEELEPIEVFRKEIELTSLGKNDAPYFFLAVKSRDKVIGGITGNYLKLKNSKIAAGAIGYCAVKSDARGKGIGRATVDRFCEYLSEYSLDEGRSLISIVLEAQTPSEKNTDFYDSRPFWAKLGWRIPEGAKYSQPSLKFDENGKPKSVPVSLTFMIKQSDESDQIKEQEIRDIVKTIFDNWYIPDQDKLSKTAYLRACGHVYGLLGAFFKSLKVQENWEVRLMNYAL